MTTKSPNSQPLRVPNNRASIESFDRVFVGGQTGSGKTVLSMTLLYKIKRLFVVDNKNSLGDWNLNFPDKFTKDKIREGEEFRVRVTDNDEGLDYFEYIYKTADKSMPSTTVYIDEVNAFITSRSIPQPVLDIWQRGREKKIGGWASTQRPVSIPILFLTEAYHLFAFRMTNEEDRKRVAGYMTKQVREPIKDRYGFYYYNVVEDKLTYTRQLPL